MKNACDGGSPTEALELWTSRGMVTGGHYDSDTGCFPYSVPPCDHYDSRTGLPRCENTDVPVRPTKLEKDACKVRRCPNEIYEQSLVAFVDESDAWDYDLAHNTGRTYDVIRGSSKEAVVFRIMREIEANGPVLALMTGKASALNP